MKKIYQMFFSHSCLMKDLPNVFLSVMFDEKSVDHSSLGDTLIVWSCHLTCMQSLFSPSSSNNQFCSHLRIFFFYIILDTHVHIVVHLMHVT